MGKAVETRFGKRAVPFRPGARPFRAAAGQWPRRSREPFYRQAELSQPAAPDRLAGLDLLRFFAALMILVFHFGFAGPVRGTMTTAFPEIAGVSKYAFVGVDLFFVISGFVIAVSAEGRSWGQFAVSRFLRLYPAHAFCMCATAVVMAAMAAPHAKPSVLQWLANLTMLAPVFGQKFMDGAYWSIVIEIVFYGWVALLLALGLYQRWLLAILAVWLAVACVNELFFQWRPLRFALATEYAGMFVSGMLIHRIRTGARGVIVFGLLGCAIALGALHALEAQRAIARIYADHVDLSVLLMLHGGIYAVLLAALWLSRRNPATPLVLTLGGLTYPLYLIHQNAGYLIIDALAPLAGRWCAAAVVVSLALAFSYAVHRFVEPFGRRFARLGLARLEAAPVPASPKGVTQSRH